MRSAPAFPWPAPPESRRRQAPRGLRGASPGDTAGVRERARRRVVRLVLAIYLLAIFEGALRKWVLPEFNQWLFFVRDPLLLLAYAVATRHRLWPRGQTLLKAALLLGGLGIMLGVLQAASGPPSEWRGVLGVYGWRAYFLYVPLAFLVGAVFGREDLQRIYRLTLWLALPIAALVAVQFFSPQGAAVNVGRAADEALQFRGIGLDGTHTRPMGTFSSVAGQQQFVATACTLVLALFVAPRTLRRPPLALVASAAVGVVACAALSGSRGTVLQCALAAAAALSLAVVGRGGALKGRALAWPLALGAAAAVLVPLLFAEGFAAFMQRWTTAEAIESKVFEGGIFGRSLFGLVDFLRLVGEVPLLGYGLGFGGNASITLGASIDGVQPGYLAETDFARHMVDLGPLFGSVYIAFRLLVAAWLTARVLQATRQAGDPLPWMLLSYAGYVLVLGQITGQGAINLYGWLFTGLAIAACEAARPRRRPHPTPAAWTPAVTRTRR